MGRPDWRHVVRFALVLLAVAVSGCVTNAGSQMPAVVDSSAPIVHGITLDDCTAMALAHSVDKDWAESLLPLGFTARDELQVYYPETPANSGGAVIAALGISCGAVDGEPGRVDLFGYGVLIYPPMDNPRANAEPAVNDVYVLAAGASDLVLSQWLAEHGLVGLPVNHVNAEVQEHGSVPGGPAQRAATMSIDASFGEYSVIAQGTGAVTSPTADEDPTRLRAIRFWTPAHDGFHIMDLEYTGFAIQGTLEANCNTNYPESFDGGQACSADELDFGLGYTTPTWTITDRFYPGLWR